MFGSRRRRQAEKAKRQGVRAAGRFNAQLIDFIRPYVKSGITTREIDRLVHEYTLDHGHVPSVLHRDGFPHSCFTNVNDVVCNASPGEYALEDGDIVGINLGTIVNDWNASQTETLMIGSVSDEARALVQCAFDCLNTAIDAIEPNCRISDIGMAIVGIAHSRSFSVVKDYVGHGIGRNLIQEPTISHVPTPEGRRQRLRPGMIFTIEPMINAGVPDVVPDDSNQWAARTSDGRLSAQFEHSILMDSDGPEILTLTNGGPQPGHKF